MGGKLSKRKKGYDVSDPKDKTEEAAPGEQTEGQEVGDPSAAGEVKPEPLVSAQAANGSTAAEPEVKPEPLVSAQAANGSTAAEPEVKPEPLVSAQAANGSTAAEPEVKAEPLVSAQAANGSTAAEPAEKPQPLVSAQAANGSTAAEPAEKPAQPAVVVLADPALPQEAPQAISGESSEVQKQTPAAPEEPKVEETSPVAVASLPASEPQASVTEAVKEKVNEAQTKTAAVAEESAPPVLSKETKPEDPPTKSEPSLSAPEVASPLASVVEAVKEKVNEAQTKTAAVAEESAPPVLSKETKPEDPPTKSEPSLSAPEVASPLVSVVEAVKEKVNEAQTKTAAVAEESAPPVLFKETKPEDPPTKSEPSLSAPEVASPLASVVEAVKEEVNEAQTKTAAVAEESAPPVLSKETKPEDPPTKSEPSLSAPEVASPLASVVEAVKEEVNEAQKELAAAAEESAPPVLSKEPKPEEPSTKSTASLPASESPAVENPDESVVAQDEGGSPPGAQEDPVSEISVTPVKKVITNSTTEPAAALPTDSEKIILEQAAPESGAVIQPEEVTVDVTEESSAEMGDQATRPIADLVQEPESVTKSKAEKEPKTEIPEPLPVESPTPVLESPSAVPSAGEPQIHTEIPEPLPVESPTPVLESPPAVPSAGEPQIHTEIPEPLPVESPTPVLESPPAVPSAGEPQIHTEIPVPTAARLEDTQEEPLKSGPAADSREGRLETEVEERSEQAESAEHPRPDEEKETTPGFQASTGTPSKDPKGAEEPCRPSMMEPVPEIVISESISTGEFLGDEAAESSEELKKVPDSPGETSQQEADEDGMGGDGRTGSQDVKAENREGDVADTKGETKPPSLEQAPEPAVLKRTEPQQEECVNGLSKANELNGINNCELQTDLMGEIADAIGDTVNQVVDLV